MIMYVREAKNSLSIELPSLESTHQLELMENDAISIRLDELMELEEIKNQDMHMLEIHQKKVKRSFDKKATNRIFKEGEMALKLDADKAKLGRHSKFESMWSGPYIIANCKVDNSFELSKT